jgi:cysteine desulfurase/selenocysteine lyase
MARLATNPARPAGAQQAFDVERIRADFPILRQRSRGRPLVYLDNAATTQKPQSVIDRVQHYYESENANIHRGVYQLSQRATDAHEQARLTVARFLNADPRQIIFTRGTTESINLVASSFGRKFLKAGDEIVISTMEHHSNIVPWQLLSQQVGARLRVIPMTDQGELRMDEYERLLSDRTRIVSVVHVSNSLGTVNPVGRIVQLAHAAGAKVLIDGAQWVAHHATDVDELDADFYAFSGHKLFGPTGIGVLYGKAELLDAMPPYQGGGDMISSVTFERTTYNDLPYKFEAGTPNISGAIGLGAAIEYVESAGLDAISHYERRLHAYAAESLAQIPGLRLIGTAPDRASVVSFVIDGVHPHDIGTILDAQGVAIRTGHHCCQPVMHRFGIPATARASIACYNTQQEIDALANAVRQAIEVFR